MELGPQELTAGGLAKIEARLSPLGATAEVSGGAEAAFSWRRSGASLRDNDSAEKSDHVNFASPDGRATIVAGGYAAIELRAFISENGRSYYAQSNFNIYGTESSSTPPSKDLPPEDWPLFSLSSDLPLYWLQTGQTLHVAFQHPTWISSEMTVWEDGGNEPAARLKPDVDGTFVYAPPHDPALDRAGATATKNIVFVQELPDGGSASFTLRLHRSRDAKRDLTIGAGVFFFCLAVGGGLFGSHLWRRRCL
ncbi:MAG: hypothetical protein LBJ64_06575 [Deltaproteobacteria bacterium]|nr:hypothetical protein [Deltaproteobacteria bacterium]